MTLGRKQLAQAQLAEPTVSQEELENLMKWQEELDNLMKELKDLRKRLAATETGAERKGKAEEGQDTHGEGGSSGRGGGRGEGTCRHGKQRGKCRECRGEGEAAGGEGTLRGRKELKEPTCDNADLCPFFIERLLNDEPLVSFTDAVGMMDKIQYTNGGQMRKFDLRKVKVGKYLEWAEKESPEDVRQALTVDEIAAVRAWTATDVCYVVTSKLRRPGLTRKSLCKVLPYAWLLFTGLHKLPERYIFNSSSGLKWKKAVSQKPTKGKEIKNEALAKALHEKAALKVGSCVTVMELTDKRGQRNRVNFIGIVRQLIDPGVKVTEQPGHNYPLETHRAWGKKTGVKLLRVEQLRTQDHFIVSLAQVQKMAKPWLKETVFEFSQQEVDDFQVGKLSYDSFIKVEDEYFEPADSTLYRGESNASPLVTWDAKIRVPDSIFSFHAPTSFSCDPAVIRGFTSDKTDKRTVFIVHGAAGWKLMDLSMYGEQEVLLEPVCHFQVLKADKFDANHLEVLMGERAPGLHIVEAHVCPGVSFLEVPTRSKVKELEEESYRHWCEQQQQQQQKVMLQCKFCPWTRLPELKSGDFQTWTDPMVWHQFWYAVHSLYPGVEAAAGGAAGPPGDPTLMKQWFAQKVAHYPDCKKEFEAAGLLGSGSEGITRGIIARFSMADKVHEYLYKKHPEMMTPPRAKSSRSPDDDTKEPKRHCTVKTEDFSDRVQTPADQCDYAPQHALRLPQAESDGMGCFGSYDASGAAVQPLQPQQSLAGASATGPQDPTGGVGLHAYHRSVFSVFLDAMTGVVFSPPQRSDDWSSYDVNQEFDEFKLAQVIGAYLRGGEVSSPVLHSFHQAMSAPDPAVPLPYFQQLQAAALTPVVTASLGAIYCYWRIEQELLHPYYVRQLARWQGDEIRGRLVNILLQLQQNDDPALLEQELKAFFAQMDHEIRLRLMESSGALRYYCRNTGSFAQVVRAPRIWCFFFVLRLRHDADFSRALWDKGFRFVGAVLDPLRVAPLDRDEWITAATGLLSGTTPGGGAGQGGGGQAANPFDDSRDPEMLVAQLLAAEGKEVDVAARAEEGEDVDLPPVSERKSLTAARLHLVSQGLVCVCWGRSLSLSPPRLAVCVFCK